ncbi:uncharacterized protein [Elaeis guineensis]|uniref:uncharacterized protein n=1 Tax=Elaeis guineensis var. tenera TaxID=51953 RepID=UPI003C6D55E0
MELRLDSGRIVGVDQHHFVSLFCDLYIVALKKNCSVASQWSQRLLAWNVKLRGPLSLGQLKQLDVLRSSLTSVKPSRVLDTPTWKLNRNGVFTVKSYHNFMDNGGLICPFSKGIWRSAIPKKIRIFLWLALRNRLHTGEIFNKKGWHVSAGCALCGQREETINHLLLTCPFTRSIRNVLVSHLGLSCMPTNLRKLWSTRRRCNITSSLRHAFDQLAAALCWVIWRERNSRIFLKRSCTQTTVLCKILQSFRSWEFFALPKAGAVSTTTGVT